MSEDYGSGVEVASDIKKARLTTETIVIEVDASPSQSLTTTTIVIKDDTPIAQQASAITVAPGIASTSATRQAPMPRLKRRPRAISFTPSKVTRAPLRKTATKTVTVDKVAQLLQILESTTPEAKIEKPGLTPEEIDEDLIAMGILPAADQNPLTNVASESPSSNSPGVKEDGRDASGLRDTTMQPSLLMPGKS